MNGGVRGDTVTPRDGRPPAAVTRAAPSLASPGRRVNRGRRQPGLSEAEDSLFGCTVYPNMFIDVTGTSAISTILLPRDPGHTTIITEYLFQPDVIASDGFDPSEIVDFVELVAHQDYVVCERVQRRRHRRELSLG